MMYDDCDDYDDYYGYDDYDDYGGKWKATKTVFSGRIKTRLHRPSKPLYFATWLLSLKGN